jgi:hypothetical protein
LCLMGIWHTDAASKSLPKRLWDPGDLSRPDARPRPRLPTLKEALSQPVAVLAGVVCGSPRQKPQVSEVVRGGLEPPTFAFDFDTASRSGCQSTLPTKVLPSYCDCRWRPVLLDGAGVG